jgi:pimeloyl-ACP methyl ester carboxylesterase
MRARSRSQKPTPKATYACHARIATTVKKIAPLRLTITAIFCLLPIALCAQTNSTEQKSPAPIGKLVDVGGYKVHLYCTGAGSPTVIIVGAGFSFNWGLVQPDVAKFTQVCAYDHSGIGWSDTGPKDSCALRVNEVHNALKNVGINGPYVFVGHSLGAWVARLYAGRYPDEVVGMVFVDHAWGLDPKDFKLLPPEPPPEPPKPGAPEPTGGIEEDPNFSKMSARDRELHMWALTQPKNMAVLQNNATLVPQCIADTDALSKDHPYPLADKPLVDVSTDEVRIAPYVKLQADLLALSENSKEIVAQNSTHFVIIDRPDVVIDAISQVVRAARNHSHL